MQTICYILKRPVLGDFSYIRGESATLWYSPDIMTAKRFPDISSLLEWVREVQIDETTNKLDGDFRGLEIIRLEFVAFNQQVLA